MGGYGGTVVPTQQQILKNACGGIEQQSISIPPQVFESIWGSNVKGAKGSNQKTLSTAPPQTKKSSLELGISGQKPPMGGGKMGMLGGGYSGGMKGGGPGGSPQYNPQQKMHQDDPSWAEAKSWGYGGAYGAHKQWLQKQQGGGAGGGVAGGGSGGGGAPNAGISMPEGQPYTGFNPQGGGGGGGGVGLNENMSAMSTAGQGLLEPGSDYYQQLSQAMQQQIGQQSAAQQRSAALRGAQSGLGAGASPEMMMTTGDIAQGGLEAQGSAEAGLALQAPQLGAGMLSSTFSPMLGLQQLAESSKQFGAGLGEQQRQFGTNTAMQQQQMAAQQAWQQAQIQAQQQAQQQEALMRQYSMMFGMF